MQNISEFLRHNIRKVRIQRDLSHEQIADLLGISPRAYTNLENGATQIDIIRLENGADILQTNIDHLLHFHEGSSQNHFYNSSHCIVANNDIFVIAREVYEDVRKVGEQWR
jgi:transcriptional regulator with XRE-family HTH domain